jgi:hypothetical protein
MAIPIIPTLLGIVTMSLAALLQTAVVAQVPLLQGIADLPLLVLAAWCVQDKVKGAWLWAVLAGLFVGFISEIPFWVFVGGYGLVFLMAAIIQRRLWQLPVVILFIVVGNGTLILHGLTYTSLVVGGTPMPFTSALNLVTLPSLLLNLFLALPVYGVIGEVARLITPEELEDV